MCALPVLRAKPFCYPAVRRPVLHPPRAAGEASITGSRVGNPYPASGVSGVHSPPVMPPRLGTLAGPPPGPPLQDRRFGSFGAFRFAARAGESPLPREALTIASSPTGGTPTASSFPLRAVIFSASASKSSFIFWAFGSISPSSSSMVAHVLRQHLELG